MKRKISKKDVDEAASSQLGDLPFEDRIFCLTDLL